MPTCVIYYRVSTKGQEDKISLPAQKRALNELAIKNDWQVLKEYTEIASGKNIKDRPIIQELLDDIIDLKIDPDYVLVYEQDRLSRGNEFWQIKMLFQDRNIKIATIDKIIDLSDDKEDLISDIYGVFAKFERRMIVSRIKFAMKDIAIQGRTVNPSFGYRLKNKQLIIEPSEASIVNKIFDIYIATHSPFRVYEYLKSKGIKTVKGYDFCHSTILRMIENKAYIGMVNYHNDWLPGNHQPIIDKNKFEFANRLREANFSGVRGYNVFLKNLIFCAHCGRKMSTNTGSKDYIIYRCDKRSNWRGDLCVGVIIDKNRVDEYVWDLIIKRIKEVQPGLSEMKIESKIVDNSEHIRKLKKRLRIIETDYYVEGKIDKSRFKEIRDDLLMRIAELEDHKEEEITDYSYLADIDIGLIKDTATIEEKRALACLLLNKVIVSKSGKRRFDPNRLTVEFKL